MMSLTWFSLSIFNVLIYDVCYIKETQESIICIYSTCTYNIIWSTLNNHVKGRVEGKIKVLVDVFSESWYYE